MERTFVVTVYVMYDDIPSPTRSAFVTVISIDCASPSVASNRRAGPAAVGEGLSAARGDVAARGGALEEMEISDTDLGACLMAGASSGSGVGSLAALGETSSEAAFEMWLELVMGDARDG